MKKKIFKYFNILSKEQKIEIENQQYDLLTKCSNTTYIRNSELSVIMGEYFKYKPLFAQDELVSLLESLNFDFKGKLELSNKDYSFLKEFYAETIWDIYKTYSDRELVYYDCALTLEYLRNKFKSIHDI